jgi:hypothetical protein
MAMRFVTIRYSADPDDTDAQTDLMVAPRLKASAEPTEPAAPLLRLVDELTDLGWPKAWIACEIGKSRALQVGKRGTVSVGNARKIRELRRRVGSMTAPPRRCREELPRLDEITVGLRAATDSSSGSSLPPDDGLEQMVLRGG